MGLIANSNFIPNTYSMPSHRVWFRIWYNVCIEHTYNNHITPMLNLKLHNNIINENKLNMCCLITIIDSYNNYVLNLINTPVVET